MILEDQTTQRLDLRNTLSGLTPDERETFLRQLKPDEVLALAYDWYGIWARPKQHPPPDPWFIWMVMTGRGWGKTRTGSEWVRERAESGKARRIALIARTKADIRDVLVEGVSGLMNICPFAGVVGKGPIYEPSKRRVTWPNGAVATLYSADEPDQLRGPEHDTAWCDELASWRKPDAWDNLMLGLRLGNDPRCIITTTPKRVALVRKILDRKGVVLTRGTTYENIDNLAESFIAEVTSMYEGTRLGLQELQGILMEDNPDALWRFTEIEEHRQARAPRQFRRIVVAVDPEATDTEESAETGIIVAGRGYDNHLYILDDLTVKGTPHVWGQAVAHAYRKWEANLVVGEVNNGGDMVGFVINQSDPNIAYKSVRASRGKLTRAEPISAIYEKGFAHHVGNFPDLESQMCLTPETLVTTDRGDVCIDQVLPGDRVWTRQGWRPVLWSGRTGTSARLWKLKTSAGRYLFATGEHPVYTKERGFVPVRDLHIGETLEVIACPRPGAIPVNMVPPWTTRENTTSPMTRVTTGAPHLGSSYTGLFMPKLMAPFRLGWKSIIGMATQVTTRLPISKPSPASSMWPAIPYTELHSTGGSSARQSWGSSGRNELLWSAPAWNAARFSKAPECALIPAPSPVGVSGITVESVEETYRWSDVYNLEVEEEHEFYAHGTLVHNCNWIPGEKSPDRMDALVWAGHELMLQSLFAGKPATGQPHVLAEGYRYE